MKATLKCVAPVLLVKDIGASATYWRDKIGFEVMLYGAPSNFAIMHRDTVRLMMAQVGRGATFTPNWRIVDKTNDAYIWVDDAAAMYQELTTSGAEIDYTLYDTPWGTREFGIQDLDDHDITFGQVIR